MEANEQMKWRIETVRPRTSIEEAVKSFKEELEKLTPEEWKTLDSAVVYFIDLPKKS